MAHWPRTVGGNLITLVIVAIAGLILVQLATALSGPFTWTVVAVLAVGVVALSTWRRRVRTADDLAAADAPSFRDTVRSMRAKDASEIYRP